MFIYDKSKIINLDNVSYMECLESNDYVYIKAYVCSASQCGFLGERIFTDSVEFCELKNTEKNKRIVEDIFNSIFDSLSGNNRVFNVPMRLNQRGVES